MSEQKSKAPAPPPVDTRKGYYFSVSGHRNICLCMRTDYDPRDWCACWPRPTPEPAGEVPVETPRGGEFIECLGHGAMKSVKDGVWECRTCTARAYRQHAGTESPAPAVEAVSGVVKEMVKEAAQSEPAHTPEGMPLSDGKSPLKTPGGNTRWNEWLAMQKSFDPDPWCCDWCWHEWRQEEKARMVQMPVEVRL